MISKITKLRYNVQREIKSLEEMKESLLLNNLELIDLYKLKVKANKELECINNQGRLIKLTRRERWKERLIGLTIGLVIAYISSLIF